LFALTTEAGKLFHVFTILTENENLLRSLWHLELTSFLFHLKFWDESHQSLETYRHRVDDISLHENKNNLLNLINELLSDDQFALTFAFAW